MQTHRSIPYFLSSLGLYVFQLLYNYFGHGVTSVYLSFAWTIPFFSGLLFLLLHHFRVRPLTRFGFLSFNTGLASLIFYAVLTGILTIAGSDSPYLVVYLYLASISFFFTILSYLRILKT